MAECKRLDFSCRLAERGQEAAGEALDGVIADVVHAVEQSVLMLTTFWVNIPVTGFTESNGVAAFLRGYLDPYVSGIVIISVIVGCIKLVFARGPQAGDELLTGLVRVFTVAALSIPLVSMLAILTDAIAVGVLARSIQGRDFGENLWAVMSITSGGNPILGFFATLILGVFAFPTALIQAALLMIRAIMLPMLAGTLVLSAAFFTTELGRQWFQRSLVWLIAFLAYKPAAAIIYASGFVMMGETSLVESETMTEFSRSLLSFVQGYGLMVLAVVSIGALIGFVVPVSGKLAGGGSGMMFAASAAGIVAAGAISNGMSGRDAPPQEAPPTGSQGESGGAGPAGLAGAAGGTVGAGVQVAGQIAQEGKRAADGAINGGGEQE